MCNKRNSTKVELRNGRIIKVDNCMASRIANTHFNTLSCCCGHNKYPKTLIIKYGKKIIDWYSGKTIPRIKRFYRKDKQRYYYIPEVSNVAR